MTFDISPLQHSDIDLYIDLAYISFRASDGSYSIFQFPDGYTPGVKEYMRARVGKGLNDPNSDFFLIRDPETKGVLGCVHWEYQREPKSLEALLEEEESSRKQQESEPRYEGVNHDGINVFRGLQPVIHREIMGGQPHAYLSMLAVHPQHQRKGVGAAAMRLGLGKADDLGLPVYLEGSAAGVRLYESWGFKVLKPFPFDPREHGGETLGPHYCMVREARKTDDNV